jgi:D-alanine transaminase
MNSLTDAPDAWGRHIDKKMCGNACRAAPKQDGAAMTEWIWLNGKVMPLDQARVGIEDRGFQFADGVYEVLRVYNGRCFAMEAHLDRLERSAGGIELAGLPIARTALGREIQALVDRSGLADAMVYLQLTRGQAERAHAFPSCEPTLLFYVRQLPPPPVVGDGPGARVVSVRDERWQRCWIKSIALLPNILAKNKALAAGADEAILIDGQSVGEGSSSNILFVMHDQLVTAPVGPKVLPGITRAVLLSIAGELGIPVQERPIPQSQAVNADEIFITSTTREITQVTKWDNQTVGGGACGPVTRRLHEALQACIASECPAGSLRNPAPAVA